jgi:hypothetical protein
MSLGALARRLTLGGVCCGLASAAPASAQTASPARTPATTDRPINIELTLTGGVDQVSSGALIDPSVSAVGEGPHSQVQASWSYVRPSRARTLTFSGDSAVRYFPDAAGSVIGSHTVGFAGTWIAGRRTTISASESVSYAPLALFGSWDNAAALADGPRLDEGLFTRMTLRHGGGLRVAHVLGRRTSATFGYEYSASTARDGAAAGSRLATAQVRRGISPGVALRVGYGFGTAQFGTTASPRLHHHLDLGIDYARPMPFSRQTTLSVRTGSVLLSGATTAYRLDASAAMRHPLGRDWRVAIGYDRPMQFVEGFDEPLLSDAVTAGLEGRIGRRIRMTSALSFITGTVGTALPARRFESVGGSSRIDLPLGRHWMLTGEYSDFQYQFAESVVLPGRMMRELRRRALRGGLTWNFGSFSQEL